jgi:hypothetical protein
VDIAHAPAALCANSQGAAVSKPHKIAFWKIGINDDTVALLVEEFRAVEEIRARLLKYREIDIDHELSTFNGLVEFSKRFYEDVAEIYDSITRVRNLERNPTGFGLNDAAILGLLVRIWKILKEIVIYYENGNGYIISLLDRQVVEAGVVAKYLLISDDAVVEDYRKCSYRDRLRVLNNAAAGSAFFNTPAGDRLLSSVRVKMERECLTPDSFDTQNRNRWRVQGKTFFDIFSEVEPPEFYKYLYGIPSESIHGSWNDSMDFNLVRNEDGTFSAYPFYQEVDIRFVTPVLRICHNPYLLWLARIDAQHDYLLEVLEWTRTTNIKLFNRFEAAYAARC